MAPRRRPGGYAGPGAGAGPGSYPFGQPGVSPQTPGVLGPVQPPQPPQQPAHLPQFPAGYTFGNDFDSQIGLPLLYVATGIVFRALLNNGQSIPAGGTTGTVLQFDTILEDPFGGWSAVATLSQVAWSWQPPFDGIYEIAVTVTEKPTGEDILLAGVGVTANAMLPVGSVSAGAVTGGAAGSVVRTLAGGFDYIRGFAFGYPAAFNLPQLTDSAQSAGGQRATSMEISLLSE